MRTYLIVAAFALPILWLPACSEQGGASPPAPPPVSPPPPAPPPPPPPPPVTGEPVEVNIDFRQGRQGWAADYADYLVGQEETIGFLATHAALPPPLAHEQGYRLASNNRSDDVFMYVYGPVAGLEPYRNYWVSGYSLTIATNAPPGCAGVGGPPGEGVVVKGGVTREEPGNVIDGGYVRTAFDKGDQESAGSQSVILGDIARSPGSCVEVLDYELKHLSSRHEDFLRIQADAEGQTWLFFGTDSGFEGRTDIYFLSAGAVFEPH